MVSIVRCILGTCYVDGRRCACQGTGIMFIGILSCIASLLLHKVLTIDTCLFVPCIVLLSSVSSVCVLSSQGVLHCTRYVTTYIVMQYDELVLLSSYKLLSLVEGFHVHAKAMSISMPWTSYLYIARVHVRYYI